MSEYDALRPGALKLKGVVEGQIKKKKRKVKHELNPAVETDKDKEDRRKEEMPSTSDERNSPPHNGSSSRKTKAEKRFEEAQQRRLGRRVAKLARKTHKDRVTEFNEYLESLSEHHDIPKVGPG